MTIDWAHVASDMRPSLVIGQPLPMHDFYQADAQARHFWRLSYRCGRDYLGGSDEHGDIVLVRHEVEEDHAYARRKRTTAPRNYAGPIIRQYNSFVFRKEAELPDGADQPLYSLLLDDIDGRGTTASMFWAKRMLAAQVERETYILIDSTASPGDTERSMAQAQAEGVRPVLRSISADDVPWYYYEDGKLLSAIYLFRRQGQTIGRYVDERISQEITFKDSDTEMLIVSGLGPEVPHPYKTCPLIPLRPQFDDFDDEGGESQIAPLAYAQKSIINKLSLHAEELYNNTYTQYVIATDSQTGAPTQGGHDGSKGPRNDQITFGAKRLIKLSSGSTVSRIGSDVAQAQSIRDAIAEEERALYRIAGISAGDPLRGPGQVESGVAKAFRFNDLAANLSALSASVELAYNTAMYAVYVGQGLESQYPGDASFPDDFTMPDFEMELQATLDAISRPALPGVIRKHVVDRFVSRNMADLSKEEREQLEAELEESPAPPPFPPMTVAS